MAWLSVWSEMQTCIRPSWCHCHSLSLAPVKSRLVLHFWYRLTWVVLGKGPLNGCVCTVQQSVASTRVQGRGDEPREPTVRVSDWSELVASYSRMKSAWGWANGGQPILVCYIRKYVIILGGYSRWRPPSKILGGCVPGGVDASANNVVYVFLFNSYFVWVALHKLSVKRIYDGDDDDNRLIASICLLHMSDGPLSVSWIYY